MMKKQLLKLLVLGTILLAVPVSFVIPAFANTSLASAQVGDVLPFPEELVGTWNNVDGKGTKFVFNTDGSGQVYQEYVLHDPVSFQILGVRKVGENLFVFETARGVISDVRTGFAPNPGETPPLIESGFSLIDGIFRPQGYTNRNYKYYAQANAYKKEEMVEEAVPVNNATNPFDFDAMAKGDFSSLEGTWSGVIERNGKIFSRDIAAQLREHGANIQNVKIQGASMTDIIETKYILFDTGTETGSYYFLPAGTSLGIGHPHQLNKDDITKDRIFVYSSEHDYIDGEIGGGLYLTLDNSSTETTTTTEEGTSAEKTSPSTENNKENHKNSQTKTKTDKKNPFNLPFTGESISYLLGILGVVAVAIAGFLKFKGKGK